MIDLNPKMNYNPLKNEENPENQTKKEIYRIFFINIYNFYILKAISYKESYFILFLPSPLLQTQSFIHFCYSNIIQKEYK